MGTLGADKVSRSDDGTLTLRDLLVKAAASRFLLRFDRVSQGQTSVCVRYTSNRGALGARLACLKLTRAP